MKTRVSVIVVALLAIMCMFSLMGCPKEPVDLTPTYIEIGGDATEINYFNKSLTFTSSEAMSWSLRGVDNGDNDDNNDITYDASDKLIIVSSADGKSATVSLKPGYTTAGQPAAARVFATLQSDTYRYGFKDITITIPDSGVPANECVVSSVELEADVGAADYSTAWWGAHSDIWRVQKGKGTSVTFLNTSSKANVWNNFVVVLQKTATGHAAADNADYGEYAVVRADNYGWAGANNTGANNDVLGWTLGNNYNWDTVKDDLDGALVTVTVLNRGTFADINSTIVAANGNTYYQNYAGIYLGDTDVDNIYFCLTVDGCFLKAPLFSYDLSGAVNDMGAGSNAGAYEPVKDHGERAEQYIDGLYYYSDANGFMDGDEGGIQFNYYAVGGIGRGYSTSTTSTDRTDKEDSSGVTYTPNLLSPIKSYIAVDADDMTTTAANVKLYITAKAAANKAPVLAVLSDNVDDTDITAVKRYFTVIEEKALTEEKAVYSFVVPANEKVLIADDTKDGPNMFVYSIVGFPTSEAVVALDPAVNSVEVIASKDSIIIDEELALAATVVAVDGADKSVTWTSSDDTIARVSATGKVTGVAEGPVTITATSTFDPAKNASVVIEVKDLPPAVPAKSETYYYDFTTSEFTADEGVSLDTFFTWKQYADGHSKGHGMRVYGNDTYWTIKVAGPVVLTIGCCQFNGSADGKISIFNGETLLTEVTNADNALKGTECNEKKYSYTYTGEATTLKFTFNQKDLYYESLTVEPAPGATLNVFDIKTAVTVGDSVVVPEEDLLIKDDNATLTLYKNGTEGSGVGTLNGNKPSYATHNNGLKLKNDCIKIEGLPAGPYALVLECNITSDPDTRYVEVIFGADGTPETYTADTDTYKRIVANDEGSGCVKGAFTLEIPYTLDSAKDVYIGVSNQWIINKVSLVKPE